MKNNLIIMGYISLICLFANLIIAGLAALFPFWKSGIASIVYFLLMGSFTMVLLVVVDLKLKIIDKYGKGEKNDN